MFVSVAVGMLLDSEFPSKSAFAVKLPGLRPGITVVLPMRLRWPCMMLVGSSFRCHLSARGLQGISAAGGVMYVSMLSDNDIRLQGSLQRLQTLTTRNKLGMLPLCTQLRRVDLCRCRVGERCPGKGADARRKARLAATCDASRFQRGRRAADDAPLGDADAAASRRLRRSAGQGQGQSCMLAAFSPFRSQHAGVTLLIYSCVTDCLLADLGSYKASLAVCCAALSCAPSIAVLRTPHNSRDVAPAPAGGSVGTGRGSGRGRVAG